MEVRLAEPPYPDSKGASGTPLWVKVFGSISLVVALLFVVLHLTRGPGGHGPGRHFPSSQAGEAPPR